MDTEKIIEKMKEELKKLASQKLTEWPIVITYPDGVPFKRAEFYEDGTAKVWPSQPLQWISLRIKLDDVKE